MVEPPNAPAFLDAEGQAEWCRLAPELTALGLLTVLDTPALALWCQSWSTWLKATKALNDSGEIIADRDKAHRKSPWLSVQRSAAETMNRIGAQFGLSPSTRAALGRQRGDSADCSLDTETNPFSQFAV